MPRPRELDFHGVFRVPPGGGAVELLLDDMAVPNGLCFSPDESTFYVDDSVRKHIRAFDVRADGSLANGRVLLQQPGPPVDAARVTQELLETGMPSERFPDGMKADSRGNLYCGGAGGIWVISPAGEHLGTIEVPEFVGNMAWGGPDWSTLYVTATTSLYRIRLNVRGVPPVSARREGR